MHCGGLTVNSALAMAVLVSGGLAGCDKGPDIVTSIEFDGATRTITTPAVICTKQPDGSLVILAQDTPRRSVRVQLTQHCLLYTSPSPRDGLLSRMPSSA